jgi:hypothetical protein
MAYWAGTLSEFFHQPKSMSSSTFSQRLRLIDTCRKIPSCKAVATSYKTVSIQDKMQRRSFKHQYPLTCTTNMQSWSKYKIVIDIDGATYSSRFPLVLQLGSAVFKIKTFEDVGTIGAIPWVHYVPIKMDLSDLEEKLEWAKNNDEKLREIAENGLRFSLRMHTKEKYKCYIWHLLLKYKALMIKGGSLSS